MSVDVKYSASVTVTGGRDGRAVAPDGSLDLQMSHPKELGGTGGPGSNPEQLFAAGYAACFLGALKFVSGQEKVKVPPDTNVSATVGIGPWSEGGFGITAALLVSLPGIPRDDARALVDKAHQVCPYSNAVRNNIAVQLDVV
jgi:Ohr subfamily peroxiredoxin